MKKPRVLIVSPALANANNGNWQTAWRWSRMLRSQFDVDIAQAWGGEPFDAMLALHARRSAGSIAAWAQSKQATANAPGLAVVLTGTDLYRDIQTDAQAQASLRLAQKLVVLQECGPDALPGGALHSKTQVIFQSTSTRKTLPKSRQHLRALMVGHLRDEKSPQTLFAAARLLTHSGILIDHIGEPLDAALGDQARATTALCAHYRWLGGLPHEATRRRIQQAHVLVHASSMEGGAHVVMEAVCSGTPVLASKIAGNVGMLGADYPGYFAHGDGQGLADLLLRCGNHHATPTLQARGSPLARPLTGEARDARDPLLGQLQSHCKERAHLFAPKTEQAALIKLVHDLLA